MSRTRLLKPAPTPESRGSDASRDERSHGDCNLRRSHIGLLTLLGTLLLTGCANIPGISALPLTTPTTPAAPQDPVLAFVASAPDGAARAVVDPSTGDVTEVTAGRRYFAASGRECRRYTAMRRPAPARAMLACWTRTGWESRPSLVGASNARG